MPDPRSPFDATARKERMNEGWDALAEKWNSWTPVVDAWFAPATDVLLGMLRLRAGDRVLELAAGTGGLTLHLARAVGPDGRVLATDVGPNMVKLAARNARDAGAHNVIARVMDGENPDLTWASMDAIVCRQGFMFFADPTTALTRLFPIVRPGGRIGLTVFTTPDRNGFMAAPLSVLSRWTRPSGNSPSTPEGPGPFSLGTPGLLETMVRRIGFADVESKIVASPLRLTSVDELLKFHRDMLGDLVNDLPLPIQSRAWNEVRDAVAPYFAPGADGVPSEILVLCARRPPAKSGTGESAANVP
jgi:ubiquinone/menaquinone biosynthesis C-methylase UbiE